MLLQSYANWEQIIIDDGSTDDTAEIVDRYKDPRIRYVPQSNQGPFELANTYNRALSLAKGELIAILEGDDFWPPEKLAATVPIFVDPAVVLAYGEAADVDVTGSEQRRKSRTTLLRKALSRQVLQNEPVGSATRYMLTAEGRSLISPSTVILRRTALEELGGFEGVPGLPLTDYPTFIELSLRGRFRYLPQILGYRRRHESSVTANHARAIHEKVCEYTLKFLEVHSEQIALSAWEKRKIEESWQASRDKLHFSEGRVFLLRKMWVEARLHFRMASKSSNLALQLIAFAGLISSWLHTDIEFVMRLAGRAVLRKSGRGQVAFARSQKLI